MGRHWNSNLRNISRGFATAALVAAAMPAASAAQRYIPTDDPEHPRIQYADSLYSLNDECIVRLRRLSRSIPPVYVNGLPIGFC